MSEILLPESKSVEPEKKVAVMDQYAPSYVRAESPLHHAEWHKIAVHPAAQRGVQLSEQALWGHLIIRGSQQNQSLLQQSLLLLGVALPTKPLTSVEDGSISVRWLSPDEWLVVLPAEQLYPLEQALRKEVKGHYSVVNVSGGQTVLTLSGKHAVDVLKKSTPLDLHSDVFPVGKVASTVFAKSNALIRRTAEERWELIVRRSFADYIWMWLQDASQEYGLEIIG